MSGTSLCIWAAAPKNEGVHNSKKLAESFDCPTDSSADMVECLQKLNATDIVKHDVVFMVSKKLPYQNYSLLSELSSSVLQMLF